MCTDQLKSEISRKREELADLTRAYARSQKALWQQIPWLALQANGRGGFLDEYDRNYGWGLLALRSGNFGGYYRYFVDLESGEVVGNPEGLSPVTDDQLLQIKLDELDASAAVAHLKKRCQEPDGRASKSTAELIEWRRAIAERYGLGPDKPYSRLVPIKVCWGMD